MSGINYIHDRVSLKSTSDVYLRDKVKYVSVILQKSEVNFGSANDSYSNINLKYQLQTLNQTMLMFWAREHDSMGLHYIHLWPLLFVELEGIKLELKFVIPNSGQEARF